jgi:hypothetical protein
MGGEAARAGRAGGRRGMQGTWTHNKVQKKENGGTGIRARVERITTANANHYTIPPRMETYAGLILHGIDRICFLVG